MRGVSSKKKNIPDRDVDFGDSFFDRFFDIFEDFHCKVQPDFQKNAKKTLKNALCIHGKISKKSEKTNIFTFFKFCFLFIEYPCKTAFFLTKFYKKTNKKH